jgi:triacylglycerol lipase
MLIKRRDAMKFFTSSTLGLLLTLMVLTAWSAVDSNNLSKNETVVLLHGLGRTDRSMEKMQQTLMRKGYQTCNIAYPSRHHAIQDLTEDYVLPEIKKCIAGQDAKLSFVTHSMGGIIVRDLLSKNAFEQLNTVVMLSPPNHGSEIVDKFGDTWLFEWVMGPAGQELGTDLTSTPQLLGPATFKLGIITGNASKTPVLSQIIPGDDDGKVSTKSAQLSGMHDFLIVPISHHVIMKDDNVIQQTLFFLEHDRFQKINATT